MSIIKPANLALRFMLELSVLVAIGYWGFQTGRNALVKILLGIALPLIAAVIWGTFVSPKARKRLPEIGRLIIEILFFGSGALALYVAERPGLAAIFAILVLIHLPLTFLFNQRRN